MHWHKQTAEEHHQTEDPTHQKPYRTVHRKCPIRRSTIKACSSSGVFNVSSRNRFSFQHNWCQHYVAASIGKPCALTILIYCKLLPFRSQESLTVRIPSPRSHNEALGQGMKIRRGPFAAFFGFLSDNYRHLI